MNKTSTSLDLLRYAYNETGMVDADRIQRSIDGDPLIQDEFNDIVLVINKLDQGKVQPSKKSINNIIAFGKNLKV